MSSTLVAFALAVIAILCLVRGIGLFDHGWGPSAEGERRWFGWAYGGAAFVQPLEALSRRAPRGQALFLILSEEERAGRWTGWYPVMARYYLPFNEVVGAGVAAEFPPGVVALSLEAVEERSAPEP